MKNVFLIYDEQGKIVSGAVVHPDHSDELELIPGPGERVLRTNLESLGIRAELKFEAEGVAGSSIAAVREAAECFYVDLGNDCLVERKEKKG